MLVESQKTGTLELFRLTYKVLQTFQTPRGKNLEILNLELGKVMRSGKKMGIRSHVSF